MGHPLEPWGPPGEVVVGAPKGAMGTPKGSDVEGTQGCHGGTQGRWLWGHPRETWGHPGEVTMGHPLEPWGHPREPWRHPGEVTLGTPKRAMGAPKGGDVEGTQGSHGGTQGR